MSTKLEFPILKFSDELSPASINGWVGRCEDMYEAWLATQSTDKAIEPRTLITLAGLRMEEPTAATWWNENRDELKKLASWETFAQKVRGRFVPANWRMEALSAFYNVEQGALPFPVFAKQLQRARNTLASAGTGYAINDSIFKNHLLFRAHPILRLRVIGQQGFAYADMMVDSLIANMSSTWASLIAERVVKHLSPRPLCLRHRLAPLTYAEKEALRAANGCYHCRKTPQTPGWVKHRSDTCPGDPARGIPPRSAPAVVAAVGPPGFSSAYEEGYTAVAAVMPPYDPSEDSSFSTGTDDSDLSQRDD
ncbi:hypothetical protein DFH09DRAFT_1096678 [Mycena vulgaris]|nr:hypothetical protein DFH09DRAFT_1096678 [Mycena vulgaris]